MAGTGRTIAINEEWFHSPNGETTIGSVNKIHRVISFIPLTGKQLPSLFIVPRHRIVSFPPNGETTLVKP